MTQGLKKKRTFTTQRTGFQMGRTCMLKIRVIQTQKWNVLMKKLVFKLQKKVQIQYNEDKSTEKKHYKRLKLNKDTGHNMKKEMTAMEIKLRYFTV